MEEIIYTFVVTSLFYFSIAYYGYIRLKKNGLGLMMEMLKNSKNGVDVELREKCMLIKYTKDNVSYTIPLPYNKKNRIRDANRTVKVFYKDGTKEVLNLPPGVDLLATHDHLNSHDIHINY